MGNPAGVPQTPPDGAADVIPFVRAWVDAYAFTQVIEVPIWAYALRVHRRGPQRWPVSTCAVVGFGASAITHPFVWFVFPYAVRDYWTMVILAEAFAVGVEAAYTGLLGLRRAILWSLVANGTSVLLGFASRALFEWP